MKRLFYVIIILLLLPLATAITPLEASSMDARVLITNTVQFVPASSNYKVNHASGMLSWYPRDTWLQQVQNLTTDPDAEHNAEALIFSWNRPQQSESFSVLATVHTANAIIPVREQVIFPLNEIPDDVAPYLLPQEITDHNAQIQQLAQGLVAGKTDAYEAVYTLADWTTRNVNYSLASVGQPASQKASEVLVSRYGKCDELTSLFISLNRAVGIPARFVAGYTYTNSDQFAKPWGGHGWAEVWLPGQGWIPFDVTYGEYGYLDAGHVTLKVAPDAKETSINYAAEGTGFSLRTQELNIVVTPLRLTQHEDHAISITLDTPHATVGFGSAVLILAKVTNNKDYYVSTRLDLSKTASSSLLSDNYQNILLKPHETKTIPFLMQFDSDLKAGYLYEFPFQVSSRLGPEAEIKITAKEHAPTYDRSAYDSWLAPPIQQRAAMTVTCQQKEPIYAGAQAIQECSINGKELSTIEICDDSCTTIHVNENMFMINISTAKQGVFTRTYTAKAGRDQTQFFATTTSIAPTQLFASVQAPDFASPEDTLIITLRLNHTGAMPKNLNITIMMQHSISSQRLEDLSRPAVLSFTGPAQVLRPGDNQVTVTIKGVDELGTPVSKELSTTIRLENVGFLDRLGFWLEDAGHTIMNLFQ